MSFLSIERPTELVLAKIDERDMQRTMTKPDEVGKARIAWNWCNQVLSLRTAEIDAMVSFPFWEKSHSFTFSNVRRTKIFYMERGISIRGWIEWRF